MANDKSLYLNKIQLKAETDRCLNCPTAPCSKLCPVGCNPMEFISYIKNGEPEKAVSSITSVNPMGQTCGLICPDKFCMHGCTRSNIDFPVNIPKIQATVLENYRKEVKKNNITPVSGITVAVIGAGPAGIAAAKELSTAGYKVSIYDSSDKVGGALNMIPEARLPHSVVEKDCLFSLDSPLIDLHLNSTVSSPESLTGDYNYVIVATGEPNVSLLNIPGQELSIDHMEYLYHPEKYKTSGKVAVIGGGNVAIDCAFTALNNGASAVEMLVRRRLSDMRISKHEYLELIDKKINVLTLTSPEKIEKDGENLILSVRRNHFVNGKLEAVPSSTAALPDFSMVITAVGSKADTKNDTEKHNILYAGDCLTGGSTLVEALASGKKVAANLIASLSENKE